MGATPIFTSLSSRICVIDKSPEALQLLKQLPSKGRLLAKDWAEADEEFAQADAIVGDGAINALGTGETAKSVLCLLGGCIKPSTHLIMRVFVRHELPIEQASNLILDKLVARRFSELRFLIYGLVANDEGTAAVADVEQYVDTIQQHLGSATTLEEYRADYFRWRGLPPEQARLISSSVYFPSIAQLETLFRTAGMSFSRSASGSFPLAEYTPLYILRAHLAKKRAISNEVED
jgi:hypothetical protein